MAAEFGSVDNSSTKTLACASLSCRKQAVPKTLIFIPTYNEKGNV